ncbi:MAG TPA: hypothetical protein DCO75_00955 [Fibrobacteres bacterium]|nr:hypothetical protein [Fibrobacterota bacterium]
MTEDNIKRLNHNDFFIKSSLLFYVRIFLKIVRCGSLKKMQIYGCFYYRKYFSGYFLTEKYNILQ